MIEQKFTEIDGIRTSYLEAGPGNKKAEILLFFHGFLDKADVFEKIIAGLQDQYHIYAPDLPGSGETGEIKGGTVSFAQLAAFLKRFCDQMGIKKATVCGHSMGGATALMFAGTYPQLIRSLILFNSVCYTVKQPLKTRIVQLPLIGSFIFRKLYGYSMYRDYYMHDVYYDNTLLDREKLKRNYELFDTPARREFSYKLMQIILKPAEIKTVINKIMAPTLIIWGEKDKLIPVSCAKQLTATIKGAQLKIIPECGHPSYSEKPEAALSLMREFLNKQKG